jgi:hypothetical protein
MVIHTKITGGLEQAGAPAPCQTSIPEPVFGGREPQQSQVAR